MNNYLIILKNQSIYNLNNNPKIIKLQLIRQDMLMLNPFSEQIEF